MPVAILNRNRIQDQLDFGSTPGAGNTGYFIVWNNTSGKFELSALGTMATQAANNVSITGGSITGITDLAIADGGTGASTAADARTNLGLVAGGSGDIWVEKAGDTMTGQLVITHFAQPAITARSGNGAGTLLIGANVNSNTITANVRKLARIVVPSYDAGATNTMVFSGDLTSGSNAAYFGGTPGGSQYGCTDINFCTVATQTTTGGVIAMVVNSSQNVGIGVAAASVAAKLHINQSSATAAIPVLALNQADNSEEMIEFTGAVGTGNAIEAVGAKTLTTTHFIRISITGVGYRYIPVGTIA